MSAYDVIILGAGGAGLMCAGVAAQRGRRVLVIDHADQPGKKILISGGGRCNFTNLHTAPDRFLSANPHFATSALSRYAPQDFIDLVASHRIAWHEKTLGQLFCDGSARQIVAMLMDECAKGSVDFAFSCAVGGIGHADGRFRVGDATAPALVVATGGPSIPKMGATGLAYDLARRFGLKVVEPRPALVPLTLGGDDVLFRELSGVAADVVARAGKAESCKFHPIGGMAIPLESIFCRIMPAGGCARSSGTSRAQDCARCFQRICPRGWQRPCQPVWRTAEKLADLRIKGLPR
jgi:predicted Rossmann fold flavoprotein